MALTWHKVWNDLSRNRRYRRLSRGARLTYRELLPVAQECAHDGALTGDFGPMNVEEIDFAIGGPGIETLSAELDELVSVGLLTFMDETYSIRKFSEKQGAADVSTERVRRFRSKARNDETVDETVVKR
jgi:hypothetical protein